MLNKPNQFSIAFIRKGGDYLSVTFYHWNTPYKATLHTTNNIKGVKKMAENRDVIFIGNKPPMAYVLAIITSLSASNAKEITLKARGQAITTAVDAAEIARRRFMKDLQISKVSIGTEEMPPREGENRSRMVSTMEITLKKE